MFRILDFEISKVVNFVKLEVATLYNDNVGKATDSDHEKYLNLAM